MSSFHVCSDIEAASLSIIIPWMKQKNSHSQLVMTSGHLYLQKVYGDIIQRLDDQSACTIEIKCEQENKYGNLFIESWSNRSMLTPGWVMTCKAKYLFYYFLKSDELYVVLFQALKHWAFEQGNIQLYPEKLQNKHKQENDTWGWCVPITDLRNAKLTGWSEHKPKSELHV